MPGIHMKGLIIVLVILALIYPSGADDGGPQDEEAIETMVSISVKYWNKNFENLKENAVHSKLISYFGDANVVITIVPANKTVGIDFEDGKIVDYRIGEEIPDSKIEARFQMSTFRNVFYADDPTPAFLTAYRNDEIELKGRTTSTRALLSVTDRLKGLIPSDSSMREEAESTPPEMTEGNRGPAPTIEEEHDEPAKDNFLSSLGRFITGILSLFGR